VNTSELTRKSVKSLKKREKSNNSGINVVKRGNYGENTPNRNNIDVIYGKSQIFKGENGIQIEEIKARYSAHSAIRRSIPV
jgi:hypothetical protein